MIGESNRPQVSVVVATHNRAVRLSSLLESLASQTLDPQLYEVVVVDDGSSDETREILEREHAGGRLRLSVLQHESPRGPAAARDAGWRASEGSLVAFTDDDCEVDPRWLEACLEAHRVEPTAVVQGMTTPIERERGRLGPFTRTIEVTSLDAGFQTCNIIYPRELLERIEGFDIVAFDRAPGGEDADLAWRAIAAGAEARFDQTMVVQHAVNELGPLGKLRVASRWTTPMQAYVRHPGLRDAHFVKRYFWKGSHYLLFRALLVLVTPRRLRWLYPWLVLPYLQEVELRRRRERGPLWILPYYLVHDLVESWAILRAAIRYRHPML